MLVSEELVYHDVLGGDPAYPREVAECLEQVAWDDVPDGRANEAYEEESLSGDASSIADTGV